MRTRVAHILVSSVMALAAARGLHAQASPEVYGVVGSFSFTRTSLAFDSAAARVRNGPTLGLGVRICALCWYDVRRVTITPRLALAFTDIRGIKRSRSTYAFSRLDIGEQLAVRVGRFRPYVTMWHLNKRTAEVNRDSLNYVEPSAATTFSFGVEMPFTTEGRGLDISFTSLSGRFREAEYRKKTVPVNLGYTGWTVTIGWSGPFTGSGLPWR